MSENDVEQPIREDKRGRRYQHPQPRLAARVQALARTMSQEAVAQELGFCTETLVRYYKAEYEMGKRKAIKGCTNVLLQGALKGRSINAAWKYLQLQGVVRRAPDLPGSGGPVPVDLSRLNAEQLHEYGRLSAIAAGLDPDSIVFEQLLD